MILPIPPERVEQDRIVEQISTQAAEIELAASRLDREIALLREYRTRLVADLVTGKLDVRDAAGRLPDESPAPTTEDDTDPSTDPEAAGEEVVV